MEQHFIDLYKRIWWQIKKYEKSFYKPGRSCLMTYCTAWSLCRRQWRCLQNCWFIVWKMSFPDSNKQILQTKQTLHNILGFWNVKKEKKGISIRDIYIYFSCSKEMFESEAPVYNNALHAAGDQGWRSTDKLQYFRKEEKEKNEKCHLV